jgi:hypothetical protein
MHIPLLWLMSTQMMPANPHKAAQPPICDNPVEQSPVSMLSFLQRLDWSLRNILSGATTSGSCAVNLLRWQPSVRHCQRWRRSFTATGAPCAGRSCRRRSCQPWRRVDRLPQSGQTPDPMAVAELNHSCRIAWRPKYVCPAEGPNRFSFHAAKLWFLPQLINFLALFEWHLACSFVSNPGDGGQLPRGR